MGTGRKNLIRDPEAVFNIPYVPEDTPEDMLENIRAGNIGGYRIKTTITGEYAHSAIFPYWKQRRDAPERPRRERSVEEIKAANERRSIQRGQDLLQTNFSDGDIWFTGTWDDERMPEDEAGQLRYVQNYFARLRRRHIKNSGSTMGFKYYYTMEEDAAEGVRPNVHVAIRGELTLDEAEKLWRGGGRNQSRRIVSDENGITGMAVYITKPAGKRKRRWGCSKGLTPPLVVKADKKATKGSVRKAAESSEDLLTYFKKLYPGWEITQVARPAYNERSGGVCLYARMRIKQNLAPGERIIYKPKPPPFGRGHVVRGAKVR